MDVKNEIIKTIELLIDKKISQKPTDFPTVVSEIKGDRFGVRIDGVIYYLKDGVLLHPSVGTKVWVHCPNGKMSQAYISALR